MAEKNNFASLARIAAVLTLICTLVAALLSGVYALTNEVYENNLLATKQAAIASLFGRDTVEARPLPVDGTDVQEMYGVYAGDEWLGCCANVKSAGFGGDIDMMVAAGPDGKLLGVSIVSMSETPGLGSRAGEMEHLVQYRGISVTDDVVLGESVDAISGATVSSKAVNEGVRRALEHIRTQYDTNENGGDPQ